MQADYGLYIEKHCWSPTVSYCCCSHILVSRAALVQNITCFFFTCPEIRKQKYTTLVGRKSGCWSSESHWNRWLMYLQVKSLHESLINEIKNRASRSVDWLFISHILTLHIRSPLELVALYVLNEMPFFIKKKKKDLLSSGAQVHAFSWGTANLFCNLIYG